MLPPVMSEQPTSVQRIRTYLKAGASAGDPSALATEYAAACRDANERLGQCGERLRDGLRALALAEALEPTPLLDLVASLQLRDIVEWERVCLRNDWPLPPRLAMDLAGELADATAEAETLRPLMDRLQALAANDAPLIERLQVVRKLVAADPYTPQWRIDAQEMERTHLDSVQTRVTLACQARNLREAIESLDELGSPLWLTKPPMRIVQPILDYVVPALLEELSIDQSNQNEAGVRDTLQAAQQIKARWTFAVPVLDVEIPKAVSWLKRQAVRQAEHDEFGRRCDALLQLIEVDAPLDQLQRNHARATRFEWELPAVLATRYAQVVGQKERAILHAQLRRRTAIALGVAAIIIAGLSLLEHRHSEALATDAINRLNDAMDNFDWKQANDTWTTLSKREPAIARRDDVRTVHQRVMEAAKADATRSSSLEALLQTMGSGKLGLRDLAVAAAEAKTLLRRPDERVRFDQMTAISNISR